MAKKRSHARRPKDTTDAPTDAALHVPPLEEAPGGTVSTPDQDRVDQIGEALGVPRGPDEEVRTSSEILDERDTHRWEQEEP
jgi:hypothetical protein